MKGPYNKNIPNVTLWMSMLLSRWYSKLNKNMPLQKKLTTNLLIQQVFTKKIYHILYHLKFAKRKVVVNYRLISMLPFPSQFFYWIVHQNNAHLFAYLPKSTYYVPSHLPTSLHTYLLTWPRLLHYSLVNPIITIRDDAKIKSHVGIAKNFQCLLNKYSRPKWKYKVNIGCGFCCCNQFYNLHLTVHLMHNSWLQWIERFLKVKVFCENFLSFICKSKGKTSSTFSYLQITICNERWTQLEFKLSTLVSNWDVRIWSN